MPALSPEQHAAVLGLEALYERFDGGRANGFHENLLSAASGGMMRNHFRSIHEVLTARGDSTLIPAFVSEQERDGPDFTALLAVQTLVEVNLIGAVDMGRESAGLNLAQYQQEVVMRDPLTVLLTNG